MPDFDAIRRDMGLVPDEQPTLRDTIKSTPEYSPDEHAQDLNLGKKLGLPADVVKDNRKDAQLDARFADTPETKIKKTAPTLFDRIRKDPDFAILSQDDLEELRQVEDGVRRPGYASNIGRGIGERASELWGNLLGMGEEVVNDLRDEFADLPTEFTWSDEGFQFMSPNEIKERTERTGQQYIAVNPLGRAAEEAKGLDLVLAR